MESATLAQQAGRVRTRAFAIGRPPIPHEHGAWVILYAPLVLGFAAAGAVPVIPAILLIVGITGAFLGRNAAQELLRRRQRAANPLWTALFAVATLAGGVPLITIYRNKPLLWIGAAAAILFGLHSAMAVAPTRKRLDRSQWGELLGVGALALTAPAAYSIAAGRLDPAASWIWAVSALYFGSAIFRVKLMLAAATLKRGLTEADRWRLGRDSLIYHALMLVVLPFLASRLSGIGAGLLIAGFLPVIVRAWLGWSRLSPKLPPLKRVGVLESVWSLWFLAACIAAIMVG